MLSEVRGAGDPLVLVPGGLTGWLSWIPHAERLAVKRKVARVQLLNVQYGLENQALPPNYSIKTESQALANTLDELGLRAPVDLAAWSYGALVALDFALDHSQRIRTLTLIEPPAIWLLRADGRLDQETEDALAMLTSLREDITEADLERFLCAVGLCPPGQPIRQHPQWPVWVRHRRSLRNSPAAVEHTDQPSRLKNIRCPVLLVKGVGSAGFLRQIIDRLAAHIPQAEVIDLPAGHAPQIVSMDSFLEELEGVLARGGRK